MRSLIILEVEHGEDTDADMGDMYAAEIKKWGHKLNLDSWKAGLV